MFINFGVIESLTDAEQITFDSYQEIKSIIKTYIEKASKLDEYGMSDKASPIWEYGNRIIYLVGLLFIIREKILEDYSNCKLDTFENYKTAYKLDCIKKTFSCLPIPFNVTGLYEIFGLNDNFGFDGITFTALEIDNTIACNEITVFEVQQ